MWAESTAFYILGSSTTTTFERSKAAPSGIQSSLTENLRKIKTQKLWCCLIEKWFQGKTPKWLLLLALHYVCLSFFPPVLISSLFFDIEQSRPNILQSGCVSVPNLSKSSRVKWKLFHYYFTIPAVEMHFICVLKKTQTQMCPPRSIRLCSSSSKCLLPANTT